jgi:lipoprotein-releasing system permease protein
MYKITLAIRYLLKRRITYFAILAVALCVFIVLVVMTVMAGLVNDFKEKNHLFTGDCVVSTESLVGFAYYEDFIKILEETDFVEAVSPAVKSYALIGRRGSERRAGVEILGIDPALHSRVTGIGRTLEYHKEDASRAFEPEHDPNLPGVVFGIDLLYQRDVHGNYTHESSPSRMSYSVSCFPLTPRGAQPGSSMEMVNTKTFYFSDKSQSGLARVDGSLVYLPLESTQILCGMTDPNRASAIHIKFKKDVKLQAGCDKVAALWDSFKQKNADRDKAFLLDKVAVRSWKDYRRSSIAPMEKEQTVMTVMFGFVGITTIFIVFVVSYMIISHKTKDIGILKSIGASNCDIIQLFAVFGFLVGLLGSGIGLLAGWVFLAKINEIENWLFEHFKWQLWDRTIYAIGDIPNRIEAEVVITIFISAIVACLIGVLAPSWQAARQRPVETLQVNQL